MQREDWRENALCLGQPVEVFFPHDTLATDRWDAAKLVCKSCRVKKQCLNLVIGLDPIDDRWGVFGGKTPQERIKERERLDAIKTQAKGKGKNISRKKSY